MCAGEVRVTERRLVLAIVAVAAAVLLLSAWLFAEHFYGHGGSGRASDERPLPAALSALPTPLSTLPATPRPQATTPSARPAHAPDNPALAPDRPGTPVRIIVPSHDLDAAVSADPLRADGFVYVPRDPRDVSWTSGTGSAHYSAPGSNHGTAMLVSHINYSGVPGAFHDLASYRVGQHITLVLADGRRLAYTVTTKPLLVKKSQLADDLKVPGEPLHHKLFDQTHSFARAGGERSGRLLLQSCGGRYDNRDGSYEDNVFVFALPA